MDTIVDLLFTSYQAILLTYTVKKQFSQKPHSILWEVGNVSLIVLLLAAIQYLHLSITDNVIFLVLLTYVKLTSKERFLTCAFWVTMDAFLMAGTLTLVSNLFDIRIGINGSVLSASQDVWVIYALVGNASITLVMFVAANLKIGKAFITNKAAILFLIMLLFEYLIGECFFMARMYEQNRSVLLTGTICSFVVMLLIIILYELMTEAAKKQKQAEMSAATARLISEYQSEMKTVYQKMLAEQHDFRHRIAAAEEILHSADMSAEQRKKADQLLRMKQPENTFVTGCMAVDAILRFKATIMENAGITFEFSNYPLNPLPVSEEDFCMLLGNLLDNAIEGVLRLPVDSPSHGIHLAFSRVWDMLFISCANDADLSTINRNGDVFLSTKSQPALHGFGIENMKAIVRKAQGTIEFELNNGKFIVEIMLGGATSR